MKKTKIITGTCNVKRPKTLVYQIIFFPGLVFIMDGCLDCKVKRIPKNKFVKKKSGNFMNVFVVVELSERKRIFRGFI